PAAVIDNQELKGIESRRQRFHRSSDCATDIRLLVVSGKDDRDASPLLRQKALHWLINRGFDQGTRHRLGPPIHRDRIPSPEGTLDPNWRKKPITKIKMRRLCPIAPAIATPLLGWFVAPSIPFRDLICSRDH